MSAVHLAMSLKTLCHGGFVLCRCVSLQTAYHFDNSAKWTTIAFCSQGLKVPTLWSCIHSFQAKTVACTQFISVLGIHTTPIPTIFHRTPMRICFSGVYIAYTETYCSYLCLLLLKCQREYGSSSTDNR